MKKIINISEKDYEQVNNVIDNTSLSWYELNINDFIVYKDDKKIIAFWRIFNIWNNDYELSSLWVNEGYRWWKIWIELIKDLVQNKFDKENNLFLACKKELENYYKKVSFEIVENNIPEKLEWTIRWWEENNFFPIIMKYKK